MEEIKPYSEFSVNKLALSASKSQKAGIGRVYRDIIVSRLIATIEPHKKRAEKAEEALDGIALQLMGYGWIKEGETYVRAIQRAHNSAQAKIEALEADNAALREPLETIAENAGAKRRDGLPFPWPAHDKTLMWVLANKALDTKRPGTALLERLRTAEEKARKWDDAEAKAKRAGLTFERFLGVEAGLGDAEKIMAENLKLTQERDKLRVALRSVLSVLKAAPEQALGVTGNDTVRWPVVHEIIAGIEEALEGGG